MTFLPNGYKTPEPKGGKYFKPAKGESRVRILTQPILGFERWTLPTSDKPNGQPVRRKLDDFAGVAHLDDKKGTKHFWAMAVWNYSALKVQVWQITQNTIQTAIESLSYTKDWGDPRRYDLIIDRDGEGLNTVYTVMPAPPSRLNDEAREAMKDALAKGFDLTRLYNNGDPFTPGTPQANHEHEPWSDEAPPATDADAATVPASEEDLGF